MNINYNYLPFLKSGSVDTNNFSIAVSAENSLLEGRALELANMLKLPIVSSDSKKYPYLLLVTSNKLVLKSNSVKNTPTVYVDFLSAKQQHRQKNQQRELLIKALGRLDPNALIVDATAGFGEDAFVMANKGYRVILIERMPIFAALLQDGLNRLYHTSQNSSHFLLELIHEDAKVYLPELAKKTEIAVVYLDPMFPERKKSALSRKEMEILRKLAGGDRDGDELLRIAMAVATHRVVVKRPRLAEPLAGIKPKFSLTGKISRFDIYILL